MSTLLDTCSAQVGCCSMVSNLPSGGLNVQPLKQLGSSGFRRCALDSSATLFLLGKDVFELTKIGRRDILFKEGEQRSYLWVVACQQLFDATLIIYMRSQSNCR